MSSRVETLAASPRLTQLYARALRPGASHRPRSVPDLEVVLRDATIDRDHLAAYDRICGFRLDDRLPPTYPSVLAFPLQLRLMTDEEFPFALPGMVHIRNVITQRRTLHAGARLTLRVRAERLRAHPKGAQVDLVVAACHDADDPDVAWSARSTYLARGARLPADVVAAPDEPAAVDLSEVPCSLWTVSKDTGRRYARVSGDVNPIHLHPLPARLFGFSGAIAHGMWTKARALAALGGRLADAMTADVTFRQPLPLPSTVRFAARPTSAGWDFSVLPVAEGRAHLTGGVGPA